MVDWLADNEAGSDGEFSDRSWRLVAAAVSVAVLASSCLSRPVSLSHPPIPCWPQAGTPLGPDHAAEASGAQADGDHSGRSCGGRSDRWVGWSTVSVRYVASDASDARC